MCAVTAQLICAFVFAYICCLFSHVGAHIFFVSGNFSNVTILYFANLFLIHVYSKAFEATVLQFLLSKDLVNIDKGLFADLR